MPLNEVVRLLKGPHTGVLSTLDPRGFPHSVGIYYVPVHDDQLELHMWVYGKSQKVRNVERDPRASVLVEIGEPYVDLRGTMLRGPARIERDREAIFDLGKQVYERYFFQRTGIPLTDGPIANIERQSEKRVNLVLTATKIASWDHSKGRDTIASRAPS
jgi:general stress protein 26